MIILDTMVVSEMIRTAPAARVIDFLKEHEPNSTYITAITAAEMRYGYSVLPAGQRRASLTLLVEALLTRTFAGRILSFDLDASRAFAELSVHCRASGYTMPVFDSLIAAITLRHQATLVTRNVKDFRGCPLAVVNPWEEELPA